jgi:hypothetical protein
MRTPKTRTLFFLAAGLLLLAAVSVPTYYPGPTPVLRPDGSPLLKPDGTPVVHRDMAELYRLYTPAFIFIGCSVCMFTWWLVRVLRFLRERFFTQTS